MHPNPEAAPSADLKSFSCLTCRQRKVKCDRRIPCSNCKRAAKQCSFIPPVRGKRRSKKSPKEGLHAKLKRYEELLRSYGAKIEASDNVDSSDGETVSEPDVEMSEDDGSCLQKRDPFRFDETKPKLIAKDGSSRYFENGPWSSLGQVHLEQGRLAECIDESSVRRSDLDIDSTDADSLMLGVHVKLANLASLHPPFHLLQSMLEIYLDRFDFMSKIVHIPTFWPAVLSALQHPHSISKSLQALIFAFYLVTVCCLGDDECPSLLGESKEILLARYMLAARQAMIEAEFLKTTSLTTLQAYLIFLMGMRCHYQSESLFILSGVAVRIARRMGLHRDGASLGLAPFETEMRRRLWWHIVAIDCRTADFSGTKPSIDLFLSDTKIPLNLEDEDLSPDMAKPPTERTGITSIVLCLMRCDVLGFLRTIMPHCTYDVGWNKLSTPSITLAAKDKMISEIEDTLERKYVRYCDPSNSLHCFVSILARSSVCKMKLLAHNPRQFADYGVKVPQKYRDIIFENGLKLLEYSALMEKNDGLRKYMWQLSASYLWDSLLYVLIEARHRKLGPEVERAWRLIGDVISKYPQIFAEAPEALDAALGNWTLQVWDDCAAAKKAAGLPEPLTPGYITVLRHRRMRHVDTSSKPVGSTEPVRTAADTTDFGSVHGLGDGNLVPELGPTDSYDFSNLLSFDLEPDEWAQWERLFSRQAAQSF